MCISLFVVTKTTYTVLRNWPTTITIMSFDDLPKWDDLENKKRYWPAKKGTKDEGLGMLRYLTPAHVAQVVKSEVQTGERVCSHIRDSRRRCFKSANFEMM